MPNIELMDKEVAELMDKEVAELIEYIALYHSPNEDGTIVYNMDSTQEERFRDLIRERRLSKTKKERLRQRQE